MIKLLLERKSYKNLKSHQPCGALGFPNRSWLGEVIEGVDGERQSIGLGIEHLRNPVAAGPA